jgi:hypothetical protein
VPRHGPVLLNLLRLGRDPPGHGVHGLWQSRYHDLGRATALYALAGPSETFDPRVSDFSLRLACKFIDFS